MLFDFNIQASFQYTSHVFQSIQGRFSMLNIDGHSFIFNTILMTVQNFKKQANHIFMVSANEFSEVIEQSDEAAHLQRIIIDFSEALNSIYELYCPSLNDSDEKEIAEYKRILHLNMSNIYISNLPVRTVAL